MSIKEYTQRMTGESIAGLITQLHKKNAHALIRARGKSMAPFIQDGDLMTIISKKETPCLGDIVAFLKPDSREFIVHRIVGKSGISLIAKGDNVFGWSDVISVSDVIGFVTEAKRKSNKPQWIGLGPEKKIISLLSRSRILNIFLFFLKKFVAVKKNRIALKKI